MLSGSMPDITPAQIVALIGAAIGVAVAAGLPLSRDLQDSIIRLVTVLAPVILVADAHIRNGRARAFGSRLEHEERAAQPEVERAPAQAVPQS